MGMLLLLTTDGRFLTKWIWSTKSLNCLFNLVGLKMTK
uniref:Uncharacterized protein n=1 Tax=Schistosoma japonicum TaxID=6182 RepID=Q5C2I3_SCHJA|nr:unknown [Schistosoma japonicum]